MNKFIIIGLLALFSSPAIAEENIEAPVLVTAVKAGDIITENDIKMVEFPAAKLRDNIIMNPGQLVGKTPRKHLQAGRLIRVQDVSTPLVVEKGRPVTIVFETDTIEITSVGIALDNGSEGDAVRVKNSESNRLVKGFASEKGVVLINPRKQVIAANIQGNIYEN